MTKWQGGGAKEDFEYPYFYQTVYSDSEYFRGHAQLRNSSTTAILASDYRQEACFNQGIFIDIFVLDGVEDSALVLALQKMSAKAMGKVISCLQRNPNRPSLKKRFVRRIISLAKIKKHHLYGILEWIYRKKKINRYQYVAPLSFIFETKKRIRNRHIYDEIVWLDFETMKIPAPARYDEFLHNRYGDYWKPSRIPTTHGEVWFDTEKPYTVYLNGGGSLNV